MVAFCIPMMKHRQQSAKSRSNSLLNRPPLPKQSRTPLDRNRQRVLSPPLPIPGQVDQECTEGGTDHKGAKRQHRDERNPYVAEDYVLRQL